MQFQFISFTLSVLEPFILLRIRNVNTPIRDNLFRGLLLWAPGFNSCLYCSRFSIAEQQFEQYAIENEQGREVAGKENNFLEISWENNKKSWLRLSQKHCFTISYRRENQRHYELKCNTESECSAWIIAIREARYTSLRTSLLKIDNLPFSFLALVSQKLQQIVASKGRTRAEACTPTSSCWEWENS